MQPSAVCASAIRALSNKLHGPLPLTRRETQQLLNLLTTSFQSHLDQVHPSLSANDSNAKTRSIPHVSNSPTSQASFGKNRVSRVESSQVSIAQHALDILSHPLLAKKPNSASLPKPRESAQSRSVINASVNPLPWLEEKFAAGSATTSDVAYSLRLLCGMLMKSGHVTGDLKRIAEVKESGGGMKIFKWLQAGGTASETEVLAMKPEGRYLVSLLSIEERWDVLWALISKHEQLRQHIAGSWVLAASKFGNGLESAMKTASAVKAAYPLLPTKTIGRIILYELINRPARVTPEIFHEFVDRFFLSPGHDSMFDRAVLTLYHPVHPTTQSAWQFFRKQPFGQSPSQSNTNEYKRTALVRMALYLTQRLIDENNYADAQDILSSTRVYFSSDIGSPEPDHGATETLERASVKSGIEGRKHGPSQAELENIARLDAMLAT